MESERVMSEALSKQAIELGALLPGKARVSENVLDLLGEIAGGKCGVGNLSGAHSGGSAVTVHAEKSQYPDNDSRRYVGQVLIYSCASPAVLAILQMLSDMYG